MCSHTLGNFDFVQIDFTKKRRVLGVLLALNYDFLRLLDLGDLSFLFHAILYGALYIMAYSKRVLGEPQLKPRISYWNCFDKNLQNINEQLKAQKHRIHAFRFEVYGCSI